MEDLWASDEELLVAVGEALRSAGPVPAHVTLSGRAAWAWRTIDAELATLTFDSALREQESVRSLGAAPRLLVFDGGHGCSVEFAVTGDGLTGRLLPPVSGQVSLLSTDGAAEEVSTDADGRFVLSLPTRPFRLLCRTAETTFTTDWLQL